jgi:hypothetical protein
MSKEAVQTIIGKAVTDSEFRKALFANPEEVLAGFELTEVEIAGLKAIDVETMDSFAGALDERISKAFDAGLLSALPGRLFSAMQDPGGGMMPGGPFSAAQDPGGGVMPGGPAGEPPAGGPPILQHFPENP